MVEKTVAAPILRVRDLTIGLRDDDNATALVDGVSFDVAEGEALCIVGESGSGKSLTVLSVLGLLRPELEVTGGSIAFRGAELVGSSERELSRIRGRDIGIVFQDPMTSLNPLRRVGAQLAEAVRLHDRRVSRRDAFARIHRLLARIGVPQPEVRARAYPHEWSGGMRQRAVIAMAVANDPALIIADEPTTALDVTIQAQVMQMLRDVRSELGSALVLITHNLALASENADRMIIMYSGRIMESGRVESIFRAPAHPYTAGLLASLLIEDSDAATPIPGNPPSPQDRPSGCPFAPRCPLSMGRARCTEERPRLRELPNGSAAACHFAEEQLAAAAGGVS